MNVYMYNLSDEIFMETIIYLQNFGLDYFEVIRNNLDKFDEALLEVGKRIKFLRYAIELELLFTFNSD